MFVHSLTCLKVFYFIALTSGNDLNKPNWSFPFVFYSKFHFSTSTFTYFLHLSIMFVTISCGIFFSLPFILLFFTFQTGQNTTQNTQKLKY